MNTPKTREDLEYFLRNQIQESIHLDYKDSRALDKSKKSEICKDVSAFANSDGGLLIYGIKEDSEGHYPLYVDKGVDNLLVTKEWLENIINSNIEPIIDGLIITQIALSDNHSAFCVSVPKSYRAPHQESNSNRYYKRYNFSSIPMEHYEILDIQNRKTHILPFINISIEFKSTIIYIVIENIGDLPITDVTFKYDSNMEWDRELGIPSAFETGVKFLYPKRKMRFLYGHYSSKKSKVIEVTASYKHPYALSIVSDLFHYDLTEIKNSLVEKSDIETIGEKINNSLKEITKSLESINKKLETTSNLANPSGLKLSITTLRNLKHLLEKNNNFEKLQPQYVDLELFMEVLGVDRDMADRLSSFFSHTQWQNAKTLEEVEGMTDQLLQQINTHFRVS